MQLYHMPNDDHENIQYQEINKCKPYQYHETSVTSLAAVKWML